MLEVTGPVFSVASLFAEREAKRRKDREAEEQLRRKKEEELAAFKKRLDEFQLTEDRVQAVLARIKRAFEDGESELMLTSFPSSFCTDSGRAVNNPERPGKGKPGEEGEPKWLATLPAGARKVHEYWKTDLKPGGFGFSARVVSFDDGFPGDVGLFLSWPRSSGGLNP
jgi:hypothetical protein